MMLCKRIFSEVCVINTIEKTEHQNFKEFNTTDTKRENGEEERTNMPASSPPPPPNSNNVAHSSPLVHRVSVARLPETSSSSSSSTKKQTSPSAGTRSPVEQHTAAAAAGIASTKNYVAKCRNHRNPAKKKTNEKSRFENRAKTFYERRIFRRRKRRKRNTNRLFRVRPPWNLMMMMMMSLIVRTTTKGIRLVTCVVPKLFRRPSRRDDEKEDEQ